MRDAQESGLSMLSEQYLSYNESTDGRIQPRWLTAFDDSWLGELAQATCTIAGSTVEEADSRIFEQIAERVARHGVSRKLIEALWLVERRRWQKRVEAAVVPEDLRRLLFDRAAELGPRDALRLVAQDLDLGEDAIRSSLFADRPSARRLVPPEELPTERLLRERFNQSLVEGLVVRASEVIATIPSHAHEVVRKARRLGLMTEIRERDDVLDIAVSGPLALFHRTTKYGHALIAWLPTLFATACWSLRCKINLRGEERVLELDDQAPLARAQSAGALDGKLAIEREVRRLGAGWHVDSDSRIVRVGAQLFFPDFTLVDTTGRRVGVEVEGHWTPELLAAREGLLESAGEPIMICADRCHGEFVPGRRVLLFDRKIDVSALVAACEALLG